MKLTEQDYKLLSYLYHNNREPLSKIAKACKLSREQVDYKIRKYQNEGLIKDFLTFFNWSKFGYNELVSLLLKFEKPSSVEVFAEKLKKSKNHMSYGKVFGKYDLYINCLFKDEKELGDYITELIGDSNCPVSDYMIIKPYFLELYPVKFFKHKNIESISYPNESAKRKFDNKEIEILKILAKNSRARIIDIAKKLNLSAELVVYKIKKLRQDKVISGSRIRFDMSKLGYYFSLVLLNVRDFSKTKQERIKHFARNSKHVHNLQFLLTKPNCIMQIFHKEESELREIIEEVKELLKNDSFDIEIILVNDDEGEVNTLPFL